MECDTNIGGIYDPIEIDLGDEMDNEQRNVPVFNKSIILKFEKRPVSDILNDARDVDASKIADEVYTWIIDNVENFIDSHMKTFRLDLIVDDVPSMSETKKLQDLYRAIPDDGESDSSIIDECIKCRETLDKITEQVYKSIQENKDKERELFERMIFFYEKLIPSPASRRRAKEIDEELKSLIIQKENAPDNEKDAIQDKITKKIDEGVSLLQYEELEGGAKISQFHYEAFDVSVSINEGINTEIVGEEDVVTGEKAVLKEYVIPEGFACWVELSYKRKQRPTAVF